MTESKQNAVPSSYANPAGSDDSSPLMQAMLNPSSGPMESLSSFVPVRIRIPAAPEYVRLVREAVDCLCRLRAVSDDDRAAVKLAVGEAVNNAVAYSDSSAEATATVEVALLLLTDALDIEVVSRSGGFHLDAPAKMPDAELLAERGRGIALINMMMDEVEYYTRDGNTVAHLRKSL